MRDRARDEDLRIEPAGFVPRDAGVTRMGGDRFRAPGARRLARGRRRRLARIDRYTPSIKKLNQCRPNDSKQSLDSSAAIDDDSVMITQPYQLYVERTEPSKNMARYYAMTIETTLFGTMCLTRRWGRIGRMGQQKVHHFEREEEAVHLFLDVLRQKRARGYRPAKTIRTNPAV